MAWQDDLQPASWKGVSFFVDMASDRAGRFTATHAFPFRSASSVWVEDLGLGAYPRRITGFLVGSDVAAQRDEMWAAMESEGQGELVHPSLGSLTGSIIDGCEFTVRKDKGGYIEIGFVFVENDESALFPENTDDTQSGVQDSSLTAQGAVASDYIKNTGATSPTALDGKPRLADAPGPGHA
jgi:prophage DNA circulation protein